MFNKSNYFLAPWILWLCLSNAFAEQPFADAHIHYNWDQAELISAKEVTDRLKQNNIGLTIVSGTPSHLALELRQAGGDWIIPFFSPYTHELGKRDWHKDKSVVEKATEGLQKGLYFGIGEIHFMSGFQPKPDNTIFHQLMTLAKKHDVPVLIHVDAADETYFLGICKNYPNIKTIFAHAGGNLKPLHIKNVLQQCPQVWIDLAARDDWRYGGLTDKQGHLLSNWKALILEFPDRFITGTDPVWRVTRTQSWDQSDDGWDHYKQLYDYHQKWLNDLSSTIRKQIAWDNVRKLLSINP